MSAEATTHVDEPIVVERLRNELEQVASEVEVVAERGWHLTQQLAYLSRRIGTALAAYDSDEA